MPGLRGLLAAGAIVLGLVGIYFARQVLVPFLLAAVIAYTLNPIVAALERRGIRRSWGALIVMAGLTLLIAGVLAAFIPEVIRQARQFADRLPGYIQQVRVHLEPLEAYLKEKYPEQLEMIRTRAFEWGRGFVPTLLSGFAAGLRQALTSAVSVVVWLLTVVVVPIFSYYLLADLHDIREACYGLVPGRLRPRVERHVAEVDGVLRAWIKGQLTVALTLAVIYAVGLSLLGVPLGLLIGVVGGLANMVPYLGLVAGFVPAAVLSGLDSGSWSLPLMVAGVFILGQVLEGTVISPRVVGGGLGLPPAVVLLAVLVGGELFGFTGLLLAVPTTAVGLVLLKSLDGGAPAQARQTAAPRRLLRRRRPPA